MGENGLTVADALALRNNGNNEWAHHNCYRWYYLRYLRPFKSLHVVCLSYKMKLKG